MLTGSLFSGYGGLDLAIGRAITRTSLAWVADNDPAPARVLAARFPRVPNLGDVTDIQWERVEPVEVMTGGTPCQDVSHAGHRKGMTEGTRSNLWVAMRAGIAVLRPRLVAWENVKGVLNANAETDLEHCPGCMGDPGTDQSRLRALGRVLGDLAELGYDAAWLDVRASDVGAPHLRARIFLLAWPSDDEPRWADLVEPETSAGRVEPDPVLSLLGTPAASIYRGSGGIGSASHTARLDRSYLDAQATQLADDARLLPTPVVNDMGDGKSVEWWDEWAPRQKASDGTTAVHGPSLAIEALRLLPTPTAVVDSRGFRRQTGEPYAPTSRVTLSDALLPSPTVADGDGGHTARGGDRADERLLGGIADLLPTPTRSDGSGGPAGHRGGGPNLRTVIADPRLWGKYAPAIERWATVLDRLPPPPTETSPKGNQRLSAPFVEWLMGLPPGWVTAPELGLTRNQQLRALGNGVVPLQGAHAYAEIIRRMAGRQADLWRSRGSESTSGSPRTTRSSG